MAANSVYSNSDSNFTLPIRSDSFTHNDRAWIIFSVAADTENPPLLRFLFILEDICFSMLSYCMFSKLMKSLCPSAATYTHYVRVRPTMAWRTFWIGINATMAAVLFDTFDTTWNIHASWAAAATFALCAVPCVIYSNWDAATTFVIFAIIMYQIRLKNVSYCYIWLLLSNSHSNEYYGTSI